MYRLASLFVIVLLSAADQSVAQPKVDAHGITSKVTTMLVPASDTWRRDS